MEQAVAVDYDRLVERLLELLDNADLREKMGAASRARAVSEYAWPHVIARHEELWTELSARARKTRTPRSAWMPHDLPRYPANFSAYPTRFLGEGERLVSTERTAEHEESIRIPPIVCVTAARTRTARTLSPGTANGSSPTGTTVPPA